MRPERAAAVALLLALAIVLAGPAAAAAKVVKQVRLSESGRADVMLAQNYLDTGRIDAAEARAKAALLSDPGSALPHATMALVHIARNQNDKAQTEFNRALALAPSDGAILNAYGSFLCARGDRAGAEANFQAALADAAYTTPIQPLVNAGRCAAMGQEWSKADSYLRRAVVMAPRSRQVLLVLAEVQLKLARPLEARAFVERADALGPDARTLDLGAQTEDASGDAEAAARYRKRMREQFPNYVPTAGGGRKP